MHGWRRDARIHIAMPQPYGFALTVCLVVLAATSICRGADNNQPLLFFFLHDNPPKIARADNGKTTCPQTTGDDDKKGAADKGDKDDDKGDKDKDDDEKKSTTAPTPASRAKRSCSGATAPPFPAAPPAWTNRWNPIAPTSPNPP